MFLFFLQYMGELGCEFEVYRNDELTVDELKAYGFFFFAFFVQCVFPAIYIFFIYYFKKK